MRLYLIGSAAVNFEETEDEELGDDSVVGSAFGLGIGATFLRRFDVRVRYLLLPESDNLQSLLAASVGVAF